jgi:hypothetical protein
MPQYLASSLSDGLLSPVEPEKLSMMEETSEEEPA